ncbi:MAG: DNA polymerase III subunit gamma/tau [Rhodobacter sp.]|nr:DNA polymerase III subunit gamma/tau [Rhodobacter sp.]MCA3514745.1 DNA polymerase III subunit gamma/tau [Rhodobacter sp.]MCA3519473.1 DNA polymerase III subunit gamma/tau [Rhodobacter sp.]MCA3524113.1 DNA polymerase III subunit gamma/tau [Rhodobacter sp.]MCA3525604.1 DNA polymerase III subunit gamma/tau [Rhodobacter sp.]
MSDTSAYQVLARKYRPQSFADLIGQETMVRTLRNAFGANRIAHAFVMTGVRGVGKTTTARIIAKGLNCTGPAGAGGPTIDPCGDCGPCRAIAEGRHVDVLEYDAASNTQVDKMRDILASIPYRPTEARYKIIIFDEVHMLSTGSFNALLKTLEEPPAHVKFIFATTEIRKVPVTILSRCQRYDLRRIEPEVMMAHLRGILAAEGAAMADDALALITRAAEGSVRDALSLLDQAIAHGAGETTADQVRAMLGLADRGRVLDLFDLVMQGNAAGALAELSSQYAGGADPMAVLRDLAEITHWISVVKITPDAADDPATPPDERTRGQDMAQRLPMRALSRMWQMLLKALEEVALAPNAMMAAEMAIIRLTHVADLPDPETLIRRLQSQPPQAAVADPSARRAPQTGPGMSGAPQAGSQGSVTLQGAATAVALAPDAVGRLTTFDQVVALIRDKRDMKLLLEVENSLRLVHCAPGRIEFQPTADAAPDLASRLSQRLQSWTGMRWGVSVTGFGGAATIAETRDRDRLDAEAEVARLPLVQAVLAAFPGARIAGIRSRSSVVASAAAEALPEVEGEWDPFEDN